MLSNLTGSPCQDVFQFTISGHRRRTVNRPIRFHDGVDSSDVTATSSVSTSNGCQSLFNRTNSVETNNICSLCKVSNNRKRGHLCSSCGLFFHLTCVRLVKAESNALRSWFCQRCLSPVSVTTSIPTEHSTSTQPSADAQLLALSEKRKTSKIPLKIPKGARITVAAALANIIERALVGYDHSWERLTCFATAAMSTSSSSNTQSRQSLTAAMKTNIGQFADRLTSFADDRAVLPKKTSRPPPCATDFRKMVNSKLLVGGVTAAVRIIASDDSVIAPTSEVVTALRLKQPLYLRPPPTESVCKTSSVSEDEVMVALKSFRPNSAGGVDGLRPGHLKDMVNPQTAEAGQRLMKALGNICSRLLRGQIPKHVRDLLFAAVLTSLRKKDGGIRPIAVGYVFRRFASEIAAKRVIPELRRQLPPVQFGVGVSGGCEAAAHAVRAFVQSPVVP